MEEGLIKLLLLTALCAASAEPLHKEILTTWDGRPVNHVPASLTIDRASDSALSLVVHAPFYGDPAPPRAMNDSHYIGLWDYEVVEIFFLNDDDQYLQIEIAPRGEYFVMLFDGVRNYRRHSLPLRVMSRSGDLPSPYWTATIILPTDYLPRQVTKFNMYSTHGEEPNRVYEAYSPSLATAEGPDYHRLDSFASIDLDSVIRGLSERPMSQLWVDTLQGRIRYTLGTTWNGEQSPRVAATVLLQEDEPDDLLMTVTAEGGAAEDEFRAVFLNSDDLFLEARFGPGSSSLSLSLLSRSNEYHHLHVTLPVNVVTSTNATSWTAAATIPRDYLPPKVSRFNAFLTPASREAPLALYPQLPSDTHVQYHALHYYKPIDLTSVLPGQSQRPISLVWLNTLQGIYRYEIRTEWNGIPITDRPLATITLEGFEAGVEMNVTAPFFNDPEPNGPAGKPFPVLFNYEVVEMFFLNDANEYLEVELGPWGQHLVLLLKGERNAIRKELPLDYIVTTRTAGTNGQPGTWHGSALIPPGYFPPNVTRVNAFAIHGQDDERTYEALYPAPTNDPNFPQADFHRLELFKPIDFKFLVVDNTKYSDLWRESIDAAEPTKPLLKTSLFTSVDVADDSTLGAELANSNAGPSDSVPEPEPEPQSKPKFEQESVALSAPDSLLDAVPVDVFEFTTERDFGTTPVTDVPEVTQQVIPSEDFASELLLDTNAAVAAPVVSDATDAPQLPPVTSPVEKDSIPVASKSSQAPANTDYVYDIKTEWDGKAITDRPLVSFNLKGFEAGIELNVTAPFYNDPAPTEDDQHSLYMFEVFEVFFLNDRDEYVQLVLSPWGLYSIFLYRAVGSEKQKLKVLDIPLDFIITQRDEGDNGKPGQWQGSALVPPSLFPANVTRMNAGAQHGLGGARTYELLYPAPAGDPRYPKPDFHALELFQPMRFSPLVLDNTQYSELWRDALDAPAALHPAAPHPAAPAAPAAPHPAAPQPAAPQPAALHPAESLPDTPHPAAPAAPQPAVPLPAVPHPAAPAAPLPAAPQPVAPQPVAPQPVAPQPAAPQPVAPQPAAPQPAAPHPSAPAAPAAPHPAAPAAPAAPHPAESLPAAPHPAALQPAASQPAALQPAASQPAALQPAAPQPAAPQPAAPQPAAPQPAAPSHARRTEQQQAPALGTPLREASAAVALAAPAPSSVSDYFYEIKTEWNGKAIKDRTLYSFSLEGFEEGVQVNITGPFFDDPAPSADGLHRSDEFEIFELQFSNDRGESVRLVFSPWSVYKVELLAAQRDVVKCGGVELEFSISQRDVGKNGRPGEWQGSALVPPSLFPANVTRMNAGAQHGLGGARTYELLYPAPAGDPRYPQPDFHALELFKEVNMSALLENNAHYSAVWQDALLKRDCSTSLAEVGPESPTVADDSTGATVQTILENFTEQGSIVESFTRGADDTQSSLVTTIQTPLEEPVTEEESVTQPPKTSDNLFKDEGLASTVRAPAIPQPELVKEARRQDIEEPIGNRFRPIPDRGVPRLPKPTKIDETWQPASLPDVESSFSGLPLPHTPGQPLFPPTSFFQPQSSFGRPHLVQDPSELVLPQTFFNDRPVAIQSQGQFSLPPQIRLQQHLPHSHAHLIPLQPHLDHLLAHIEESSSPNKISPTVTLASNAVPAPTVVHEASQLDAPIQPSNSFNSVDVRDQPAIPTLTDQVQPVIQNSNLQVQPAVSDSAIPLQPHASVATLPVQPAVLESTIPAQPIVSAVLVQPQTDIGGPELQGKPVVPSAPVPAIPVHRLPSRVQAVPAKNVPQPSLFDDEENNLIVNEIVPTHKSNDIGVEQPQEVLLAGPALQKDSIVTTRISPPSLNALHPNKQPGSSVSQQQDLSSQSRPSLNSALPIIDIPEENVFDDQLPRTEFEQPSLQTDIADKRPAPVNHLLEETNTIQTNGRTKITKPNDLKQSSAAQTPHEVKTPGTVSISEAAPRRTATVPPTAIPFTNYPPPHDLCVEQGLHADPFRCPIFHECIIDNGGWQVYTWRCPRGKYFDASVLTCVPGYC